MVNVVRVICTNTERQIAMVRCRKRPLHGELPGGKVKARTSEELITGAIRELREEPGLAVLPGNLMTIYQLVDTVPASNEHGLPNYVLYSMTCYLHIAPLIDDLRPEKPGEILEARWFDCIALQEIQEERRSRRFLLRFFRRYAKFM